MADLSLQELRRLYVDRTQGLPALTTWQQAVERGAVSLLWTALDEAHTTIQARENEIQLNGRAAQHLRDVYGLVS